MYNIIDNVLYIRSHAGIYKNFTLIELEEGEKHCKKCKGYGIDIYFFITNNKIKICRKCNGEGKTDWISDLIRKD